MIETYHEICKECEYIYHCFSRETAIKIQNNDTEEIYLSVQNCKDFYPERKQ